MTVKSLEPFMSYNSESKIIEFGEIPSEGEYSVTIILKDASGHSTENEFLFSVAKEVEQ